MIKLNPRNETFQAISVFFISLTLMVFFEPAFAQEAAQELNWLEKIIAWFSDSSWMNIITELGKGLVMIVGGFSIIARITPWAWDDEAVGFLTKLLRLFSMIKDPNTIMADNLAKKAQ